jgi:DNA-directed RNA polymerase specialized sigma24 family protein
MSGPAASWARTGDEDLFLQRYERLMAWASGLCAQDRQQADDLVHDAFLFSQTIQGDSCGAARGA